MSTYRVDTVTCGIVEHGMVGNTTQPFSVVLPQHEYDLDPDDHIRREYLCSTAFALSSEKYVEGSQAEHSSSFVLKHMRYHDNNIGSYSGGDDIVVSYINRTLLKKGDIDTGVDGDILNAPTYDLTYLRSPDIHFVLGLIIDQYGTQNAGPCTACPIKREMLRVAHLIRDTLYTGEPDPKLTARDINVWVALSANKFLNSSRRAVLSQFINSCAHNSIYKPLVNNNGVDHKFVDPLCNNEMHIPFTSRFSGRDSTQTHARPNIYTCEYLLPPMIAMFIRAYSVFRIYQSYTNVPTSFASLIGVYMMLQILCYGASFAVETAPSHAYADCKSKMIIGSMLLLARSTFVAVPDTIIHGVICTRTTAWSTELNTYRVTDWQVLWIMTLLRCMGLTGGIMCISDDYRTDSYEHVYSIPSDAVPWFTHKPPK